MQKIYKIQEDNKMKDLTVTQEYMICALNEKGKISGFSTERIICFIAAGLLEMKLEKCIEIENKRVKVTAELPERIKELEPLYDFVNKPRPVKIEKIVEEYSYNFTDKNLAELMNSVGRSLSEVGLADEKEAGFFGKRKCYIPTTEAIHYVIDMVRSELLEEGEVTEDIAALVLLLEKAKIIKKYFSDYERKEMKNRMKEIVSSEDGRMIKEMIDHIENMMAVMTVLMVMYS